MSCRTLRQKTKWTRWRTGLLAGLLLTGLLLPGPAAHAGESSGESFKGLDEQVQEIKSDVLGIAAELAQLEEKLLYPSHTQVAVFVSLGDGETIRLDAVELRLAGEPVARHLYTYKELEALKRGGVQRLYTGNVPTGEHALQVSVLGATADGSEFRRAENFTLRKGVRPEIVEIHLAGTDIRFRDR